MFDDLYTYCFLTKQIEAIK